MKTSFSETIAAASALMLMATGPARAEEKPEPQTVAQCVSMIKNARQEAFRRFVAMDKITTIQDHASNPSKVPLKLVLQEYFLVGVINSPNEKIENGCKRPKEIFASISVMNKMAGGKPLFVIPVVK